MKEPRDNLNNCERVENRVHELMDLRQALLSDDLVRDHISQCGQCAQLVVDLGTLNDSVSQIPLATLHRLSGIYEAELVDEYQPSKPTHPVLFVASVACLLLVALTSGIWFAGSGNADQVAVVDTLTQEVAVSVAKVESKPVENELVSNFENQQDFVPVAMQQLGLVRVHKMSPPSEMIGAVKFEELSGTVEPYQEYIGMTGDLPGMQPVSSSVSATIQLIKTLSNQRRRSAYSAL